jgi:nicotinamide-nucleotide amidase
MNRNSRVHHFIKSLNDRSLTLALAESMTCGLAAHMLSTCKGTSDVFKGSIVCYNEQVKKELMKVPAWMIDKYSAESREVTKKLGLSLRRLMSADIYAAITGLASGGGSEKPGKPVGTVFFTIIYRRKIVTTRKVFRGTPLEVREKACLFLYDLVLRRIGVK